MKRKAQWFLLPFGMIIVSFVFWGVGTQDVQKPQIVAEIGPYRIEAQQFWRTYDRMLAFYRGIFKEQFTEEMQKGLDLKNRALDEMIEQKVLLVAAQENGVRVSDRQLQDAIMKDTTFLRDGRFSRDVYLRTLVLNRISPGQYEQARRDELTVEILRRMVEGSFDPSSLRPAAGPAQAGGENPFEKQTGLKAFVDGYKRKLQARGDLKIDKSIVSS